MGNMKDIIEVSSVLCKVREYKYSHLVDCPPDEIRGLEKIFLEIKSDMGVEFFEVYGTKDELKKWLLKGYGNVKKYFHKKYLALEDDHSEMYSHTYIKLFEFPEEEKIWKAFREKYLKIEVNI